MKPHDKDAKMKYQECSKIVKQKAFERAIAGDEHRRSVVDSLDIESMSELPGYPPPTCLGWGLPLGERSRFPCVVRSKGLPHSR